jgi:PAS domain S-box-containing protein
MKNKFGINSVLNILSLEDSERDFEIIRYQLTEAGLNFNITQVERENEFAGSLRNNNYDIILADFNLPGFDAFGALKLCSELCPDVPFICVSGSIGEETAIELLKSGAVDYVLKDRPERLPSAISRALDEASKKETLRRAQRALKESEERFQILFNKAPLGYQSLDSDGKFIEVNQQWLDTLGYTREKVIGKWFGDFLSSLYQDSFRERFPVFKAIGRVHSEYEMVHMNGNLLFISFEERIGYDSHGEFLQTHSILQDITKSRQAQLALMEKMKEGNSG